MSDQNKYLDRLETKIDKQDERIDRIDVTLTEIKVDLRDHMRRTAANEETNTILKEYVDIVKVESDVRLKKLEKIKDNFYFLGWILLTVLGILASLKELNFF